MLNRIYKQEQGVPILKVTFNFDLEKDLCKLRQQLISFFKTAGYSLKQAEYYIFKPLGILYEKEVKSKYGNIHDSFDLDYKFKIDFIDLDTRIGYYVKFQEKSLLENIKADKPYVLKGIKVFNLKKVMCVSSQKVYDLSDL